MNCTVCSSSGWFVFIAFCEEILAVTSEYVGLRGCARGLGCCLSQVSLLVLRGNCPLELSLAETVVSEASRFPELPIGAGHLMPVPVPW